jgi:hypothetical protein
VGQDYLVKIAVNYSNIKALLVLGFICFTGNFLYFQDFGLYEDDYGAALSSVGRTFSTELSLTPGLISSPPQGRPLLWTVNNLGFNLLWKANSLPVLYLFVALLTSLNSFLLFILLRRHVSEPIALAACVLFLLYPADTSKQQLMHWPAHLICTAVVLVSLYAHMNAGRIASWLVPMTGAAFCILCYEPYFLLFFAFPFFKSYRQSFLDIRPFLVWIPFLLAVFVVTMLWRQSLGEDRVLDLSSNLATYLQRAIVAPAVGAMTVANSMWQRPWDVLRHAPLQLWTLGLILFVPACLAAGFGRCRTRPDAPEHRPDPQTRSRYLVFLAAAGLIAFFLGYPYRFIDAYFPPNVTMGRFSGMHAVGAFGLCIFVAAIGSLSAQHLSGRYRLRAFAQIAVCGYLLLLFMFSLQFQRDQYVRSWDEQRVFWRKIARLSPDMSEVNAVLLDTRMATIPSVALPHTEAFPFYQWNHQTSAALPYFFKLETAEGFPKLIHLGASRSGDPLSIAGRELTPKTVSASDTRTPLEYTELGEVLLVTERSTELQWDYQRNARVYPQK